MARTLDNTSKPRRYADKHLAGHNIFSKVKPETKRQLHPVRLSELKQSKQYAGNISSRKVEVKYYDESNNM